MDNAAVERLVYVRCRVDVNAVGTVLAFPVLAVTGGNVATRQWVVKFTRQ